MHRLLLSRTLPRLGRVFASSEATTTAKSLTETKKAASTDAGEYLLPGGPLAEFFDKEENFGKAELRPKQRPGRSWTSEELRLKSNLDLHKLWYVLLKERNMLLTMEHAYKIRQRPFPNPERLDRVRESMENIEEVVHERNTAFLQLETGDSADPPMRTVTSFAGFTYQKQATEHLLPADITGEKEYETPYLDESAYVTQKLWAEKQHLKKMHDADQARYRERFSHDQASRYGKGDRRVFNAPEQLPQ
uniref:Large ribosomal subunit protein uL29m n=1 Tax=Panagrellus redivivus TaxID=6233 RepID=A0A7E4UZU8_PANRE